ncbi:DUF2059 domain-containing protein [Kineobactrum salinum]|uniref:DUF2059 domain-containing protein n=1 Tax=Kineobactrum salinum TaxID=2708301 RepID=A0A6C0U0Q3_9GAMM|nr:DUF2059 domain-containing protein [Kineobactrum salinum]QIB65149.1 DUF2059 domain-containing protein [Kineobactrum salinum]
MKALKVFLLSIFLCVSSISLADSESEKEAAKLLNITGMERAFEQSISQMLDLQLQQNPALVPYKEVMLKFFNEHMSYDRLEPDLLRIYSEAFSADELREINSFYTTQVGKKTIEAMPVLMAQSVEIGVAHLEENIDELHYCPVNYGTNSVG